MHVNRFRPQLQALEDRDVPAAFSVHVNDGTLTGFNVSGQFSTPLGVDPTQAVQQLAISDLVVSQSNPNGPPVPFTIAPGATATYNDGVLVGVNATANGSDQIVVNQSTATVGGYSSSVTYDAADTNQTFTLSDGTVGALSFTIPWSQVNSNQANQSLTPTAFNLNIAGQNFGYGSASYTQQPAIPGES